MDSIIWLLGLSIRRWITLSSKLNSSVTCANVVLQPRKQGKSIVTLAISYLYLIKTLRHWMNDVKNVIVKEEPCC
ncbi:dihydrolipoyllysine-residue succinyltransferase component [Corchorus olitorius]|uniref:Dihydrolipoyllysine-residue succinyltransferase component n=1 Tax=Corchorus olitorius TaxID=93759 RepID=A0A1R3J3P9_9ROSI|nr:dihydrolipoyllysine-residue succinyltransferase component [Corchorus olitorius]